MWMFVSDERRGRGLAVVLDRTAWGRAMMTVRMQHHSRIKMNPRVNSERRVSTVPFQGPFGLSAFAPLLAAAERRPTADKHA